jgi:hypothetical protein
MKRKNRIWTLLLAAFIILCLILITVFIFIRRAQARSDRPLVLIHSPYPHQLITQGQGTAIHATSRSAAGVQDMELWIDDQLLVKQEASDEENSPFVLHSNWQPLTTGKHTIAVRATSFRGVTGQSLISVDVTEGSDSNPAIVELFPGTVPDTTTSTEGTSVEDSIPSTEAETGEIPAIAEDESSFPDEGDESPDLPLPSDDSGPPDSDPAAPDSWEELIESVTFRDFSPGTDDVDTTLRLEILTLETGLNYEQLHCYISLGDLTPRWATDESFVSLGDGSWDVFSILGGESASVFPWPGDSDLPLDIRCVGIVSGGTEALELGRINLSIISESWDGITRRAESDIREGQFLIDYRVSRESGPTGFPIELDSNLARPTNLSVGWWSLTWDYLPDDDDPDILGFRIYLNDAYQWRVPADAREAYLPFEWFNPPCGTDYIFTVTAYYYAEDGTDYESHPSFPPVVTSSGEIGDEGCDRTIRVNFKTLITTSLRWDGDREDSNGPAYGFVFANEYTSQFDGRCWEDDACGIMRLYENHEYNLHDFMTTLGDGTPPRYTLHIPQYEGLTLGFQVWDEDPGRDNDDLICSTTEFLTSDEINTPHTRILRSSNGRCLVEVDIDLALGSPVGGPGGEPPLPLLTVTDLSVDESTGQLEIHILNNGTATWAAYDLDILATWPSGELIGYVTIPEFVLLPGDSTIVSDPGIVPVPHPPLGACVELDPGNEVPEEDDQMEGWTRVEYCRPLPDLTITNVQYALDDERLLITVQNIGEGTIEGRNLDFRIDLTDGRYLVGSPEWWSGISMNRGASLLFEWPNIDAGDRELFRGGYTVTVDPNNDIAESSGTNNVYAVPAVQTMGLTWLSLYAPDGFPNSEYRLTAYLISAGSRELIASWVGPPGGESGWDSCAHLHRCQWWYHERDEYQTGWFEVFGDQELMVKITLLPGPLYSGISRTNIHVPAHYWGSSPRDEDENCLFTNMVRVMGTHQLTFSGYGWYEGWSADYLVCRIADR